MLIKRQGLKYREAERAVIKVVFKWSLRVSFFLSARFFGGFVSLPSLKKLRELLSLRTETSKCDKRSYLTKDGKLVWRWLALLERGKKKRRRDHGKMPKRAHRQFKPTNHWFVAGKCPPITDLLPGKVHQSLICYREMSTNQVKADYPHKFKPA